jgi:hypothetical protein
VGLSWFRRPTISVEVVGAEIVVRLPGTSFSVVYEKTDDNHLIANAFSARKIQDAKRKVRFPQFLALAWAAANAKRDRLDSLGRAARRKLKKRELEAFDELSHEREIKSINRVAGVVVRIPEKGRVRNKWILAGKQRPVGNSERPGGRFAGS